MKRPRGAGPTIDTSITPDHILVALDLFSVIQEDERCRNSTVLTTLAACSGRRS